MTRTYTRHNAMLYLAQARAARSRWQEAARAGMSHGEVNDRWLVYTRLAALAGPDALVILEREAR